MENTTDSQAWFPIKAGIPDNTIRFCSRGLRT